MGRSCLELIEHNVRLSLRDGLTLSIVVVLHKGGELLPGDCAAVVQGERITCHIFLPALLLRGGCPRAGLLPGPHLRLDRCAICSLEMAVTDLKNTDDTITGERARENPLRKHPARNRNAEVIYSNHLSGDRAVVCNQFVANLKLTQNGLVLLILRRQILLTFLRLQGQNPLGLRY